MKNAWEWVKRHWELFLGALVVLLGFLFGVAVQRRRPMPVPNPVRTEAEEEAAKETRKAEQLAEDQKAEVTKEHVILIAKQLEETQEKTEAIRTNPDETNAYLKNVGKAVRGDDQ